jgi:YHS domain-containing protein
MGDCVRCGSPLVSGDKFCSRECLFAYKREHPELYAPKTGRNVICVSCGVEYRPGPSQNRKFCSTTCYHRYRAEHPETYGKASVELPCEFCGRTFTKKLCQIRNTKHHFCSSTCSARSHSATWKERKAEIGPAGIALTCEQCGVTFLVRPYNAATRRFCSRACYNEFRYGKSTGGNGGRDCTGAANSNFRGTNNRTTARQVALRHFPRECMICGFNIVVSTHHITPRRHGGSNQPENLAVLCPNHHAMADRGMIDKEELSRIVLASIARRSDLQPRSSPG